jgi:hypothetical protein
MKEWLLDRTTLIWLLLMLATSFSWFLGANHSQALLNATASVSIILIAFLKVYLVMNDFMEVRSAPRLLRILCSAWMAVLCASILMLYFSALPRT